MLQVNTQWLANFDVAITHDAFVCQQAQIKQTAAKANPELHQRRADDARAQVWFDTLLNDAAAAGYHADDLWLLYNGVLWAEGLFYQESLFAPLFQHPLVSSIDRAQQLNVLLNLHKRRQLNEPAPYKTLEQDSLTDRLLRIQQWHLSLANAQEAQAELYNDCLMIEYRSLLLALVGDVVATQIKHWQCEPCNASDMVNLYSLTYQRRLQLRISKQAQVSAEADKNEQEQALILALPYALENMSIKDYQYVLHAYLQEHEGANQLVAYIEAHQQSSHSDSNEKDSNYA